MTGAELSSGTDPVLSRRSWIVASAGCLTTVGLVAGAPSAFAEEGWAKIQQSVAASVAAAQFEKALQLVSDHIKAIPNFAPAYELRAWVKLDWLDLRDDVAMTDLPLRRRTLSDPATGLSNIDPPIEVRRQYLQDRFYEKYAAPAELKSVEEDLAEYRRLTGNRSSGQAIEAFIAEFVGDISRAKELVSTRCSDGTASPREYLTQYRILRAERDIIGALASVEHSQQSPDTRNQAAMHKLSLLRALNRTKQASDFFDSWEDTSQRDVRFLFTRASISLDPKTPIQDLERLVAMMPKEAGFAYSLSVRDVQLRKDMDACMTHLTQAIESNPRSLLPYYARSCLKLRQGDAQGALADANAAIKCSPYFDMSYQVRSRIQQKLNNTEAAHRDDLRRIWLRDLYQLAAKSKAKPNDPELAYSLGRHYARGEDWNRALQSLSACLKQSPKHIQAMRQRTQIYMTLNKVDLALSDANRVVELDTDPANYSLRGDVYAQRKDWDAAVNDYENARCLDDRLEQALRNRSAWHKAAGRLDEATADLERAGSIVRVSFESP